MNQTLKRSRFSIYDKHVETVTVSPSLAEKRVAWEKLQAEDHDLAQFISQVSTVFGKPTSTEITARGKNLIKAGIFDKASKRAISPFIDSQFSPALAKEKSGLKSKKFNPTKLKNVG